jgi:hypothetical protein
LADVLVVTTTADGKPTPLTILLGKGDGTFQPRKQHNVLGNDGPGFAPKLFDINGDGLLDMVAVAVSSDSVTNAFAVNLNRGSQSAPALGFQVTVQSSTNRELVLERSIDLQAWSPIATNTPAGDWSIVDTQAGSATCFYRTRTQ